MRTKFVRDELIEKCENSKLYTRESCNLLTIVTQVPLTQVVPEGQVILQLSYVLMILWISIFVVIFVVFNPSDGLQFPDTHSVSYSVIIWCRCLVLFVQWLHFFSQSCSIWCSQNFFRHDSKQLVVSAKFYRLSLKASENLVLARTTAFNGQLIRNNLCNNKSRRARGCLRNKLALMIKHVAQLHCVTLKKGSSNFNLIRQCVYLSKAIV